ncbi:MAG: outer membrane beta-barrel protein [Terracidiphilus sp.]|nr:outer membrane beta-barrel protein [Terracidiphilus sp.]MDR3776224.1 outer membrane beta-barrel protein [Terracidiphilus sp.]
MKSLHRFGHVWSVKVGPRPAGQARLFVVLLGFFFAIAQRTSAQVIPSADAGGLTLSAGVTGSGYTLQYGERKMLGITGFVDLDTRRHLGIEGEARWLVFHQTADVHATTYAIGPRYHLNKGRFQPYAKALVGIGQFNFPYNYASGNYLVVAPGAGVDYRLNNRIRLRLADFEYQYWPQFTYGAMTSVGVSTGIRVRIF